MDVIETPFLSIHIDETKIKIYPLLADNYDKFKKLFGFDTNSDESEKEWRSYLKPNSFGFFDHLLIIFCMEINGNDVDLVRIIPTTVDKDMSEYVRNKLRVQLIDGV